ncbi:MAG: sugar phosphate isomerase/epimerase family protein, partial [Planctomycetota bacterium]
MKLSVAIADTNALPTAFVVFRGIETSIKKAASMGYQGIELALKCADEVDRDKLKKWLTESNMEVSCISTGQVFADMGLMFTDPDPQQREKVRG